jgi:hypothetical protein
MKYLTLDWFEHMDAQYMRKDAIALLKNASIQAAHRAADPESEDSGFPDRLLLERYLNLVCAPAEKRQALLGKGEYLADTVRTHAFLSRLFVRSDEFEIVHSAITNALEECKHALC